MYYSELPHEATTGSEQLWERETWQLSLSSLIGIETSLTLVSCVILFKALNRKALLAHNAYNTPTCSL